MPVLLFQAIGTIGAPLFQGAFEGIQHAQLFQLAGVFWRRMIFNFWLLLSGSQGASK
jgi:hypothetical protein